MAWTFVAAGTNTDATSGSTTVTPAVPTSSNGDLLALIVHYKYGSGATSCTPPAGWTVAFDMPATSGGAFGMMVAFMQRGASAPSSPTCTFNAGTGGATSRIESYTPPAGGTGIAVDAFTNTQSATAITNQTATGFTTGVNDVLLLANFSWDGPTNRGPSAMSGGSGTTWTTTARVGATGTAPAQGSYYGGQATAGATGNFTTTAAFAFIKSLGVTAFKITTGGGGGTAALTGVGSTGATGTTTANNAVSITGVSASGAVGTVTASTAYGATLTGVAASGATGNVGSARTIALGGVVGSGAIGTVAPSSQIAISGAAGSGARGNVGSQRTVSLAGVSATSAVGSVTATNTTIVGLSGVAGLGAAGSVSAQADQAPRNMGFEISVREPVLERRKREHQEKLVYFANQNRKRKARKIEIQAAELFDGQSLSTSEAEREFMHLLRRWESLGPEPAKDQTVSLAELFKLQVFLRIQQQIQDENDEDDLLISLLFA